MVYSICMPSVDAETAARERKDSFMPFLPAIAMLIVVAANLQQVSFYNPPAFVPPPAAISPTDLTYPLPPTTFSDARSTYASTSAKVASAPTTFNYDTLGNIVVTRK